jgi:hypothetical protein
VCTEVISLGLFKHTIQVIWATNLSYVL